MHIFYGMPKKTKLKTIFAPLCGKSPEQVMAPAVADAHKLGYDKLYRLLLDYVGPPRSLECALRLTQCYAWHHCSCLPGIAHRLWWHAGRHMLCCPECDLMSCAHPMSDPPLSGAAMRHICVSQ